MKLERGQDACAVPDIGEILDFVIDERRFSVGGIWYPLTRVSPEDLMRARESTRCEDGSCIRGMPAYFAQMEPNSLALHPVPDRDYEARLIFYPPRRTI